MATVSVVIPLFNDAEFVGEALQSVLDQTRPPDQIIVVDDGSTDASYAVASRFLPAITLLSQPNQGISGARNTGIVRATGDLIAFLDADDMWPQNSLQARLERLEADDTLDAVYGQVEQFITPGLDPAISARLICPQGRTAARFAGAMLMRRQVFERVGLFDPGLKVGETIDWALRLDDSGAAVAVVDSLVMRRRIHGANTMVAERPASTDYFKALRASVARKAALQQASRVLP